MRSSSGISFPSPQPEVSREFYSCRHTYACNSHTFFFLIKNSKPFQVPGNKFLFLEKKIEQKNQASGMLWDSYAMLYFLNKNQDKGFDEYFSASFRCERQPRKSNVVTSGSALRLIGGLPWWNRG